MLYNEVTELVDEYADRAGKESVLYKRDLALKRTRGGQSSERSSMLSKCGSFSDLLSVSCKSESVLFVEVSKTRQFSRASND